MLGSALHAARVPAASLQAGLRPAPAVQPTARSAFQRDSLLLELCARARWPLHARRDVLWLYSPGDVSADGRRLTLAARLWERRAEYAFTSKSANFGLPFEGLLVVASAKKHAQGEHEAQASLRLGGPGPGGFTVRLRLRVLPASAAAPAPGALVERELFSLGIPRGPSLQVQFDNLEELCGSARAQRNFVTRVLAGSFRRASASLAPSLGPELSSRRDWLAQVRASETSQTPSSPTKTKPPRKSQQRIWHSREAGVTDLGLHSALRAPKARAELRERLLQRFLDGLRWPLPDAGPGWQPFFRADDLPTRLGLETHDALDCGALISASAALAAWPAATPIHAPHAAAQATQALRPGSRAWRIDINEGKDRLSLWLGAYHLDTQGRLSGLDGDGSLAGWQSSDPALRALGWPKGNHLHIEVLGTYEQSEHARLFLAWRFAAALEDAARRLRARSLRHAANRRAQAGAGQDAALRPRVLQHTTLTGLSNARAPAELRLGLELGLLARALPRIPGLVRIVAAGGDRFELHAANTRLPSGFQRRAQGYHLALALGASLTLVPSRHGRPQQPLVLSPGPLQLRLELSPGSEFARRSLRTRRALVRQLLPRLAEREL